MDWGLRGSPLFVCLLLLFAEKPFFFSFIFFFAMPSAPQQESPALSTCKPLVNDHCVEALITIPFEFPTLLFFHGLKLYAKENKNVIVILWLSNYVKWNCSCVLLVMVNGRALDGLRKEHEGGNWEESGPCSTHIDIMQSS